LGIGQGVTFFEKILKKVAISPNPINTALYVWRVVVKFEWEVEENDDLFPSVKLIRLLFKPKDYKERVKHYIQFGQDSISYHAADSILWHIAYSRLGHLELPKSFSAATAFNNSYTVYVHTNDNDQYGFQCTLPAAYLNELKTEIEQRTKNV